LSGLFLLLRPFLSRLAQRFPAAPGNRSPIEFRL